jgi:ABC-type transporter Mla subunit MlaD
MQNRSVRNNLLAGAFVLISIALAVWGSFLLTDRGPVGASSKYTVRFSLSDGATGLKNGSPVLLGGQQIGVVRSVEFATTPGPNSTIIPNGVNVRLETRADLALYENAAVYLEIPLLGTLSSINIRNAGNPDTVSAPLGASALVEAGETINGRLAPPAFLAQAGFGAEQAEGIKTILKNLESTVSRLSHLADTGGPQIETAISDTGQLVADLKARLETWSKQIDTMTANLEKASGKLDPILVKTEAGIDSASATITEIRDLLADNRESIDRTIASLESAAAKVDQQLIDDILVAVKEGREALDVLSGAVQKVGSLIGEEAPSLRRTLANLRLMSDQLKLTAIEVRSQPWRLLYQPTTKELESQVLYDSTRAYAEAASDLRAASETLSAAAATQTGANGEPATPGTDLAELTDRLNAAIEKYREAEAMFLDSLIKQRGK